MPTIPFSIQWIKRLLLLKLLLMLIVFGLIAFVVYTKPEEEGFLFKFTRYILSQTGNGKGLEIRDPVFLLSYLFGYYIFFAVFAGLEYYFVSKRMQAGFWIVFFLDLLFTISNKHLPIIALFLFILGIIKPTRLYFSKNKNSPLLLDDDSFE